MSKTQKQILREERLALHEQFKESCHKQIVEDFVYYDYCPFCGDKIHEGFP
jgi:hypothetical protein